MSEHSLIVEGQMPGREDRKERLTKVRSAQILDAALKVFAKKGYRGATIREIASEAGVAEGTIYNYFPSKKDLLISIPGQLGALPMTAMADMALKVAQPDAKYYEGFLRTVLSQGMKRLAENKDFLRVLLSTLPSMDEETLEEYIKRTPLYFSEVLEGFLETGIKRGVFREMNTAIVARAFIGVFIIHILIQEMLPPEILPHIDYDEVAEEVVRLFLYGVAVHKEGVE
jgi:AcrR family transcriptional regulator